MQTAACPSPKGSGTRSRRQPSPHRDDSVVAIIGEELHQAEETEENTTERLGALLSCEDSDSRRDSVPVEYSTTDMFLSCNRCIQGNSQSV